MPPRPPKPPYTTRRLLGEVPWTEGQIAIIAVAVTLAIVGAALALLARPSTSVPLGCSDCGTAFALSPATEGGGPGAYWYNFSVQSASGGMTLGDLEFQVQTPTGQVVVLDNASLVVSSTSPHTTLVGSYSFATSTWTSGAGTLVSNQQQFDIECSNDLRSLGDALVVLGNGGSGFTGSITVSIP